MGQGQVDLLREIVAAPDKLPVRGLVTTGPGVATARTPSTPRVEVVPAAPHHKIMPHASAVISHGGHGTVIKALAAGVPQLVIPLGRDQPNNAARVTHYGVGLHLKPSATADAIAHALDQLLHDSDIADHAAVLGPTVRADAETHSPPTPRAHYRSHQQRRTDVRLSGPRTHPFLAPRTNRNTIASQPRAACRAATPQAPAPRSTRGRRGSTKCSSQAVMTRGWRFRSAPRLEPSGPANAGAVPHVGLPVIASTLTFTHGAEPRRERLG